jgi:hypothetical protein
MSELLACENTHLKALNLRAKAFYNRNEILKCYIDLNTALLTEPQNQAITKFIAKLESSYPELRN